jgi:CelD/BcsL family acetyltransferase involved in cellulose biosynthesis
LSLSAIGAPPVRVIDVAGELSEIESTWDSISAPWASPAQSYDYIRTCVDIFGLTDRLTVLVVTNGVCAAIAPLYRSNASGRLELVGERQLHEATDFRYSRGEEVDALARAIVALGAPLRLGQVPQGSPVIPALRTAYRNRGLVVARPAAGCPGIALDERWAEPELQLNSGRRSDLRRARRIADGLGTVRFDVCPPDPATMEALLAEAFAVEAKGWKARQGSALAVDAKMGEFYRRYASAACRKGVLRLCFMRIDGRAIAMQLAIEAGRRFWLLKIGYDEEFKRCSPGTLLTAETIRYAASTGLSSYEFLGVDEEWIHLWKPEARECVRLQAYPANLRGAWALGGDGVAAIYSRLKLFAAKRRRKH